MECNNWKFIDEKKMPRCWDYLRLLCVCGFLFVQNAEIYFVFIYALWLVHKFRRMLNEIKCLRLAVCIVRDWTQSVQHGVWVHGNCVYKECIFSLFIKSGQSTVFALAQAKAQALAVRTSMLSQSKLVAHTASMTHSIALNSFFLFFSLIEYITLYITHTFNTARTLHLALHTSYIAGQRRKCKRKRLMTGSFEFLIRAIETKSVYLIEQSQRVRKREREN